MCVSEWVCNCTIVYLCASHLPIITTQPVCRPYLRDLHLSPCGEDVAIIVPVQHEALDGAVEGGRRSVDLDLNKTTVMDHVSNNRHQHETSNEQLQNSNMSEAFGLPKILHHVKSRAANPSLDLSVLKSDFKRRNLILSVMHMVLCKSIFPGKMRQHTSLAWSSAERVMSTTKFAQSISAQITSKCHEDCISHPIKWETFSVLPIALFMWCFQLMRRSTSYIPPWVTEKTEITYLTTCPFLNTCPSHSNNM